MWSHPLPEGTLVWTHCDFKKCVNDVEIPARVNRVAIIESYIREYNPCDSFYYVIIGKDLCMRERGEVWPAK